MKVDVDVYFVVVVKVEVEILLAFAVAVEVEVGVAVEVDCEAAPCWHVLAQVRYLSHLKSDLRHHARLARHQDWR